MRERPTKVLLTVVRNNRKASTQSTLFNAVGLRLDRPIAETDPDAEVIAQRMIQREQGSKHEEGTSVGMDGTIPNHCMEWDSHRHGHGYGELHGHQG